MPNYPEKIKNLIDSFSQLPGIGRKTAERFVFYLIKQPKEQLHKFATDLYEIHKHNFTCPECFNFSQSEGECTICKDEKRDRQTICVVEQFQDLNMLESTNEFNGLYHVLGGKIDPPEGVTPDTLTIDSLIRRIQQKSIQEIILAMNPDIQGEGTIIYLKNILRPLNVKITLLARGLPMGSNIEYADEVTLSNAIKGRREIN
jgi:recombination protein RecR